MSLAPIEVRMTTHSMPAATLQEPATTSRSHQSSLTKARRRRSSNSGDGNEFSQAVAALSGFGMPDIISGLAPRISFPTAIDTQLSGALSAFGTTSALDSVLKAQHEQMRRLQELAFPHAQLLERIPSAASAIQAIEGGLNSTIAEVVQSQADLKASELMHSSLTRHLDTLSSLHLSMRIHATPIEVPSLVDSDTEKSSDHGVEQDRAQRAQLIPTRANNGELEFKPETLADPAQVKHLLRMLNDFLATDEVSEDAKEGIASAIAWHKLGQRTHRPQDGQNLNILIHAFLRHQQGLSTQPGFDRLLSSGLLIAKANHRCAQPELEPRIYTSNELAIIMNYDEGTIRRKAKAAWSRGALPQPLDKDLTWYVVGTPNDSSGGRKCGWKFQKRCFAQAHQQ
jgi:hypothetical protein